MIRVAKFAGAAAIAAISLTVPATAAVHGRVVAHHIYRPPMDRSRMGRSPMGRPLYDVVPQGYAPRNSDDPALTGGGSLGYNQMIYNS